MSDVSASANNPAKSQLSSDLIADGLLLDEYARSAGLDEAEVWKRLRRGELIGRTQRGRLYVYAHEDAVPPPAATEAAKGDGRTFGAWVADHDEHKELGAADLSSLPPLPAAADGGALERQGASGGGFLALTGERTSSPELALLLDHLSLAKEENREILRMTQQSIQKVTELTDKIVEMKDTVIDAKDQQILALMQQLEAKDQRIRSLAQQNEDFEMLARTLAADQRPR